MRRGLVGHDIGRDAARQQLGQHLGGVAQQSDRERPACAHSLLDQRHGLFERVGRRVEVAGLDPPLDALPVDLHHQRHAIVHRHGQRLRAAHAAQPGRQQPAALERATEVPARALGQCLVGALQNALRADIDPAAGGHLAVHRQAQRLQAAKLIPGGPLRHQQRVCQQHARRIGVGAQDAHRLARLDQQRLVIFQRAQRAHDRVVALPVARGLAGAAIDDQLVGIFGHLGVEVVHEHAQGRLLAPAFAGHLGSRAARESGVS